MISQIERRVDKLEGQTGSNSSKADIKIVDGMICHICPDGTAWGGMRFRDDVFLRHVGAVAESKTYPAVVERIADDEFRVLSTGDKPKQFGFMQAVEYLFHHKRVRRAHWIDGIYIFMDEETDRIRVSDGTNFQMYGWDIRATDWELVGE
jgi:hypothetical protein